MRRMRLVIIAIVAGTIFILLLSFFSFKNRQIVIASRAANKGVSLNELILLAKTAEEKNELLQEKDAYKRLIDEFPSNEQVATWQKKLGDLNMRIIFSSIAYPSCKVYEVGSGDTLAKIAKQFNTTVELITRSNNLSSDRILPGRKLKIWTAPFTLVIDKSQNILILKSNEEILKTYIVSTGMNNSTPAGTFKIINKLTNPVWYKPGVVLPPESPENILGSRWLGFDLSDYGIHGTTDPGSIGKQATQGCIRMLNQEVEELYSILPIGTEVTIID